MPVITCGYDSDGNAKDYTTLANAIAAASDGDEIWIYFSSANQGLYYPEALTISTRVSLINKILPKMVTIKYTKLEWQNAGDVYVTGIKFSDTTGFVLSFNFGAGSSGNLFVDRCAFVKAIASSGSGANGATIRVRSSILSGATADGFYSQVSAGDLKCHNCTSFANRFTGFTNSYTLNCTAFGMNFACYAYGAKTGDYCVSDDGSAPGANSVEYTLDEMSTYADHGAPWRLRYDSPLIGAGTSDANALGTDFYGNTWTDDTIGCDAGAAILTTDKTVVLVSAGGTFDESARNTDPGEENVESGVTYKIQNVDLTGTLVVSGAPATPTLTVANTGTSVTFTVSGSDSGTTNEVFYAGRAETSWTSFGSRTDDGDVVGTLAAGYYFAYCKSTIGSSSVTEVIFFNISATPTVDADFIILCEEVKDYLNLLGTTQSFTAERRNRVREDLSTIQDLNVWVVPESMTSTITNRQQEMIDYVVDVAVVRAATSDSDIDDMMLLVSELSEGLSMQVMDDFKYLGQTNEPIYSAERLDNEAVFLSVIRCTYKNYRSMS